MGAKKKTKKDEADGANNAKLAVLKNLTNIITLSTIINSGGSIPEGIEDVDNIKEGVKYFTQSLNKLINIQVGEFHWK